MHAIFELFEITRLYDSLRYAELGSFSGSAEFQPRRKKFKGYMRHKSSFNKRK